MAKLYINEYAEMASAKYGPSTPITGEPADRTQAVSIGTESIQSNEFHTETDCHIRFGKDPKATPDDMRLPANATVYFGIRSGERGQNLKLAVIV